MYVSTSQMHYLTLFGVLYKGACGLGKFCHEVLIAQVTGDIDRQRLYIFHCTNSSPGVTR